MVVRPQDISSNDVSVIDDRKFLHGIVEVSSPQPIVLLFRNRNEVSTLLAVPSGLLRNTFGCSLQ